MQKLKKLIDLYGKLQNNEFFLQDGFGLKSAMVNI